jgi:fatty-acyl-CoA synthase
MWQVCLRKGDHLAVFMENNARYYDVIWATLRSGLILTTINRYLSTDEAAYILNDCEAKVLISSKALADTASGLVVLAPECKTKLMVDGVIEGFESYEEAVNACPTEPLAREPGGSFMLYSSGTTGKPKGIVRAAPEFEIADGIPLIELHVGLWNYNAEMVYLSPAPLYHSAPLGFSTAVQSVGGTVVMMERFDPVNALAFIDRYQVTHSQWVPTMFTRFLKLSEKVRSEFNLHSHQVAIHAAAPCPRQIKQQMIDWWGPIIFEYYGGTEVNGLTHITSEEWLTHEGSVGKPILGITHICDDTGAELEAGKSGLVYFEMPEMPFEYHNDADKTKSSQHPQNSNWSALGDVGYVDEEGYLYLTDRASFMIISGGVNIYPQEIEDALVMHPKVADVAVIGVPNAEMGEEVKAVVQVMPGTEKTAELEQQLLAYTRDSIAHYKCPKSIDFEDELPRLPTGKLYKRLLKDRYWGSNETGII